MLACLSAVGKKYGNGQCHEYNIIHSSDLLCNDGKNKFVHSGWIFWVAENCGGEWPSMLPGLLSHQHPGRSGQDPGLEHRWAAHRQLLHWERHHHQVREKCTLPGFARKKCMWCTEWFVTHLCNEMQAHQWLKGMANLIWPYKTCVKFWGKPLFLKETKPRKFAHPVLSC